MPRRGSKKSILEKKPKLEFLTSPLHGPTQHLSPVFGAVHPLTAKTIGVDESNTWVSPHFQQPVNRDLSVGKIRLVRGTRAKTRQRRPTSDKENLTDSRHGHASRGLKSLVFIGDKTNKTTPEVLRRLTRYRDVANDPGTSPVWDVRTPETQNFSPETGHNSSPETRHNSSQETGHNSSPETGHNSSPESRLSSENVIIMHKRSSARKVRGDNSNTLTSRGDNSNRLLEMCRTPNLIQSPLGILSVSCDDSQELDNSLGADNSHVRRSHRLKEKYLDSLKVALTPPREMGGGRVTVLVADTPEAEYGLSVRRKQLAQLKIRTKKITS